MGFCGVSPQRLTEFWNQWVAQVDQLLSTAQDQSETTRVVAASVHSWGTSAFPSYPCVFYDF
jgi:hypothetical protein